MSYFHTKAYGSAAPTLSASAGSERDAMSQNAWLHAGISYINLQNKNQARMAFQQASEMDFDSRVLRLEGTGRGTLQLCSTAARG